MTSGESRSSSQQDEPALPKVESTFSERLTRTYGVEWRPTFLLDPDAANQTSPTAQVERLTVRQAGGSARYQLKGEVGQGGMGAVLRVFDADLRRHIAMKVIRGGPADGSETPVDPKLLSRFLEEAQVTAQLDHPGITPVHELGVDPDGRVYFTMKLVKGRNLKEIFDLVREGKEDWTRTRALGVLLKVCEALSYAHAKGVTHRDLKPANVMVGRFGEVYVVDWGVARVKGQPDKRDLRLKVPSTVTLSIATDRRDARDQELDSAMETMDGAVVGTPVFMPPEQAAGRLEDVDARSDVYALGAMLYNLLAGRMPYEEPGARPSPHTVLAMVLHGPPKPIRQVASPVPAELEAICEKAMARDPEERYGAADEMAQDLRAYLDGRVVQAYESGAIAEIKKWVVRNKLVAAAAAVAVMAVIGGLVWSRNVEAKSRREIEITSDYYRAYTTLDAADALWPARPEMAPIMEEWLQRARDLVARRPLQLERMERLERQAQSDESAELDIQIERQAHLVAILDELGTANSPGVIAAVADRLERATSIEEATVRGSRGELWSQATASIADRTRSPHYEGLRIKPQLGLVPLGQDPDSGLWEFADFETGEIPGRDGDGRLVLSEESCLVFVLIPGGTFLMGAQSEDPLGDNYDENVFPKEGPVHQVSLGPFFLSKYEMTQGQWTRVAGKNSSMYQPPGAPISVTLLHPIESVDWSACQEAMQRLGLRLPTEAQWEYACRAGTATPWSTGAEALSLVGFANVGDRSLADSPHFGGRPDPGWPRDGYVIHAPVGSFKPNPWGLHDIHGNVFEWTRDPSAEYSMPTEGEEGLRVGGNREERTFRGGSWYFPAAQARSTYRVHRYPELATPQVGLRPSRKLEL